MFLPRAASSARHVRGSRRMCRSGAAGPKTVVTNVSPTQRRNVSHWTRLPVGLCGGSLPEIDRKTFSLVTIPNFVPTSSDVRVSSSLLGQPGSGPVAMVVLLVRPAAGDELQLAHT